MVQRPFIQSKVLHIPICCILLVGWSGGDTLSININVQPYAHALLTPGRQNFIVVQEALHQTQTLTVAQEGF